MRMGSFVNSGFISWSSSASTPATTRALIISFLLLAVTACGGSGDSANSSGATNPSPPTGNGSASLSWVAPTTNIDGSAFTDLTGFKIYRGTSATDLQSVATVAANQLTYTVNNLAAGTHYFAVTAVNANNIESGYSNVGSKTIP